MLNIISSLLVSFFMALIEIQGFLIKMFRAENISCGFKLFTA